MACTQDTTRGGQLRNPHTGHASLAVTIIFPVLSSPTSSIFTTWSRLKNERHSAPVTVAGLMGRAAPLAIPWLNNHFMDFDSFATGLGKRMPASGKQLFFHDCPYLFSPKTKPIWSAAPRSVINQPVLQADVLRSKPLLPHPL